MIREIVKDQFFLQLPAQAATREDGQIGQDLLDTLMAHRDHCVGLAANMIGFAKTILAVADGRKFLVMYNPVIVSHSPKPYETMEGCLSLPGERPVTRYERIEVQYEDQHFKKKRQKFSGLTAQAIQHEMDHFMGKLV